MLQAEPCYKLEISGQGVRAIDRVGESRDKNWFVISN